MTAGIGIVPDPIDRGTDLIDAAAVGGGPGSPLDTVDRPELAVGIGPVVPDTNAVLLQIADVALSRKEPQQLVEDRAGVQFLGGQEGEAIGQIEAHLVPEDAQGPGAGSVSLFDPFVEDPSQQVQIRLHRPGGYWFSRSGASGLDRSGALRSRAASV